MAIIQVLCIIFSHIWAYFSLSGSFFPVSQASFIVTSIQFSAMPIFLSVVLIICSNILWICCLGIISSPNAIIPSIIFVNYCAMLWIYCLWYIIQPLPRMISKYSSYPYNFLCHINNLASHIQNSFCDPHNFFYQSLYITIIYVYLIFKLCGLWWDLPVNILQYVLDTKSQSSGLPQSSVVVIPLCLWQNNPSVLSI